MKHSLMTLGAATALTFVASGAFAQSPDTFVYADAHGNGVIFFDYGFVAPLDASFTSDPGPGGSSVALTYSLGGPPSIVPGDVSLLDPTGHYYPGLIRFNPGDQNTSASFVFYSKENGASSFPTDSYTNSTSVFEQPGGVLGIPGGIAEYNPGVNDPGYVSGFDVVYVFAVDAVVPEPSTYAALGFGVLGVAMLVLRSRRRRTFTV